MGEKLFCGFFRAGEGGYHVDSLGHELVILRIDADGGNAHLGKSLCRIPELQRENDKVRLKGDTALKVKVLCCANVGKLKKLRRSKGVDRTGSGLCLYANKPVVKVQSDKHGCCNVISADQLFRLALQLNGSSGVVGDCKGLFTSAGGTGGKGKEHYNTEQKSDKLS